MSAAAGVIGGVLVLALWVVIGLDVLAAVLAIFRRDMRLAGLVLRLVEEVGPFFAVGFTVKAVFEAAGGNNGASLLDLVLAAVWLWTTLHNQNGRWRRRAKKAAGVVRDLGHRLVVVPVAVPAGA
jgi:hypothetical protein